MHSFGVHFSQSQKPHCRQHLQQQQEQQINITIVTMVSTILLHVNVNILKCSNFLAFSLLIKPCTSLIFTPAIFSSSTEDKILVMAFLMGFSVTDLARSQSGNSPGQLTLVVKCLLASYFAL
jgi:hypothetical protein